MGLTRVLGGILLLALFHNPVQTFGDTVPAGQNVTLNWSQNTDPAVAGDTVYYGAASGNFTKIAGVGNVTSTTITGLTADATYYFAVTAYASVGGQSDYSNEASYGVPNPPSKVNGHGKPAGQFMLTLTGPIGKTYEIQATEDFTTRTVIGMGTIDANGSLDFTDTNAANFPQRLYRTRETP